MGQGPALTFPFLTFQDWVSMTQGPPVPLGWHRATSLGSPSRTELGEPQGTIEKVRGLLSKGKQLLRKLGSGKKE